MKTKISILLLFFILKLFATEISTGNVSGEWTKENSPYNINGDILIPEELTLSIENGVEIIFKGRYSFNISGAIKANGLKNDSIRIYADQEAGWKGIRIDTPSAWGEDPSIINYTRISNVTLENAYEDTRYGGALYINNRYDVTISNCLLISNKKAKGAGAYIQNAKVTITNTSIIANSAESGGGSGIYAKNSTGLFENNFIAENTTMNYGGAITLENCTNELVISNNNILKNNANFAGAIYNYNSSCTYRNNILSENKSVNANGGQYSGGAVIIEDDNYSNTPAIFINNQFKSNTSATDGGAVTIVSAYADFIGNLFQGNQAANRGGAIYFHNSFSDKVTLCNNTFTENEAINKGGAFFYRYGANVKMRNNIIYANTAPSGSELYFEENNGANNNTVDIQFCNIQGGQGAIGYDSGISYNGTYVNNIDSDPLFMTTTEHPYQLTLISPCKNAGTEDVSGLNLPDEDLMGNGRIFGTIDMGAYELPNQAPIIISFSPVDVNFSVEDNETVAFSIDASDQESTPVYSWFLNDVDQNINLNTFSHEFTTGGNHTVKVIISDGELSTSAQWEIISSQTIEHNVPLKTELINCYPNPFNPSTTVQFSLQNSEKVKALLLNAKGQLVKNLLNTTLKNGYHSLNIDAASLTSGVYILSMQIGDKQFSKNLNLIK